MLAVVDLSFLVEVSRADDAPPAAGKASEWLRSAKGSVKLDAGATVDDARMDYYASKYGLKERPQERGLP